MVDPEETRHVPRLLAECGVRYVIVEKLPNAKIDGVCFWLGNSPVIGMSIQQDRIDNFWFVLRHESEHVLQKHGRDKDIIDIDVEECETDNLTPERLAEERVANLAAREFCVPTAEMDSFLGRKMTMPSERDILGFARRLQVHPGIVAGQVRKRLDRWDIFSRMLVKIRPHVIASATVDGWGNVVPVNV
jgi:HTH-type transcriptional regulator/antitoxin HigA